MNENISFILESLFGTDKLEDVTIDQLRELVEDYPAFNAGHYFLSKKLQQDSDEQFHPQTQVTALYFNNPFWLQWLLTQHPREERTESGQHETIQFNPFEPESHYDNNSTGHIFEEQSLPDSYSFQSKAPEQVNQEPQPEFHNESFQKIPLDAQRDLFENSVSPESNELPKEEFPDQEFVAEHREMTHENITAEEPDDDFVEDEEFKEEVTHFQPQANEWHPESETINSEVQAIHENIVETSPIISEFSRQEERTTVFDQKIETSNSEFLSIPTEPETKSEIDSERSDMGVMSEQASEFQETKEPAEVNSSSETDPHPFAEEFKAAEENQFTGEILLEKSEESEVHEVPNDNFVHLQKETPETGLGEAVELHNEPIAEPIRLSVADQAQAVYESSGEDEINELAFEPYHTVDYFASQGIKFLQEENPTDRFGRQLKSFTEWLKMMKKLPLMPIPAERNAEEQKIEEIAAHSIEEKDVVTEAMAEVWTKQGKVENAIEIYLKLSLLNPLKIAYFAAKIEELKKNNLS